MLRILSVLLVLFGLIVAGIGGAALMEQHSPTEVATTAPPPQSAEVAASEEPAFDVASVEPAPEAAVEQAPEAAPPETETGEPAATGPALTEEETQFNFQTQMEPAPMARSAPAETTEPVAAPEFSAMSAPVPAGPSFEERLKTVPVAHETPASAEYKRPFNVTFAIDATGDTTAADALPGRGVIEEGEAKVSDRVEVRLSGATFRIEQTSPPTQTLSPVTENVWRWSVTPLTAGDHDLTFEIFAIDSNEVTPLRTYRDTVTVKVSGLNRAIAFADQANPLFVLLGGLGSLLAGIFGVARFFSKK